MSHASFANSVKPSVQKISVGEFDVGQRLDNYLFRLCKGVPKSHVYQLLRTGQVRVSGRRAKPEHRLSLGEEVRLPPLRVAQNKPQQAPFSSPKFTILFEDEAILAIDKPSGVASHGGSGVSFGVIEHLRQTRQHLQAKEDLSLAHRLDRDTSGVLLLAKKRSALTSLHALLREGNVDKRYLALVAGQWQPLKRRVSISLEKYLTENNERRVRVNPAGLSSLTDFFLQARWENFSLLQAVLHTGRTHQIRAHLAHLGFALCGDDKYGDFELNRHLHDQGLKRMFLHAAHMAFPHPLTAQPLVIEAPLPFELTSFLARLDKSEKRQNIKGLPNL